MLQVLRWTLAILVYTQSAPAMKAFEGVRILQPEMPLAWVYEDSLASLVPDNAIVFLDTLDTAPDSLWAWSLNLDPEPRVGPAWRVKSLEGPILCWIQTSQGLYQTSKPDYDWFAACLLRFPAVVGERWQSGVSGWREVTAIDSVYIDGLPVQRVTVCEFDAQIDFERPMEKWEWLSTGVLYSRSERIIPGAIGSAIPLEYLPKPDDPLLWSTLTLVGSIGR